MFAFRALALLAVEHLQGADQTMTCVAREYHIVDIAALGSKKRVGEGAPVIASSFSFNMASGSSAD